MPSRSPTDEEIARLPSHYLHELPQEDEERLGKLFAKLDKDGNGKIDIDDLSSALSEHGVHHRYAEVKISLSFNWENLKKRDLQKFLKSSKSKDGDLSLADFIYYVREHEKNLRLHFSKLDRNRDGECVSRVLCPLWAHVFPLLSQFHNNNK